MTSTRWTSISPPTRFDCVRRGTDDRDVHRRYLEPITALQDDDLHLPGDVLLAYYAIYTLSVRHLGRSPHPVDELDWLIVQQAGGGRTGPQR